MPRERRADASGVLAGSLCAAVPVAGALFLASTLCFMWQSHWLGPARDFWLSVPMLKDYYAGSDVVGHLFEPVGSQRGVFPKLLFLVEYRLFRGENIFLRSCALALRALTATILIRLAWREAKFLPWPTVPFVSGMTVILLFASTQIEAFLRPFNLGWVLVPAGATVSLLALVRARESLATPRAGAAAAGWLALSIAAATVSSYSGITGLVVFPVLLLLGVGLRFPARWLLVALLAAAVIGGAYFIDYPSRLFSLASAGARRPMVVLAWLAHLFGMPLSAAQPRAGMALGAAALLAAAYLWLRFLALRPAIRSLEAVHLGLLLLAVGAGVLIGLRRSGVQYVTWDEGRYETFVMLFWLSLITLAAIRIGGASALHRRLRLATVAAVGVWTLSVVAPEHLRQGRANRDFAARIRAANDAIVVGIIDPRAYRATLSPIGRTRGIDHVKGNAPFLREHGLGMFAGDRAALVGLRVGLELTIAPSHACAGRLIGVRRFSGETLRGATLYGSLEDGGSLTAPRSIVVSNEAGEIVGLGSRTIASLGAREAAIRSGSSHWIAFIPPTRPAEPLQVWALVGDRAVCRIGEPFQIGTLERRRQHVSSACFSPPTAPAGSEPRQRSRRV